MRDTTLFFSSDGSAVTASDLRGCLERAGAGGASCLFIHSELSFGAPNPELGRSGLLHSLLEAVLELKTPTICVPTFTFSFCNGEVYDVRRSRSHMGAFNEFVRKHPDAVRSADPLMSCAALGTGLSIVRDIGTHSVGRESTFDLLHRSGGARFLFLGAKPALCFTYVHYVEAIRGVPYRYHREFTGTAIGADGNSREATYTLYVRYPGVVPSGRGELERHLTQLGLLRKARCGDSEIAVVDEEAAFEETWKKLDEDIDFLLATPYPRTGLREVFEAHDMRAL
ncbi:MAG: AAC(3) family N-acetyltransferase [Bryobacteraceae bacterium]